MPKVNPDIETFARIKVIGVGGSGKNALNHMISSKVRSVEFIVMNTDVQDLHKISAKKKIHLGKMLTEQALKSPLVKDTLLNFHNPEYLHTTHTLLIPVPLHVKRLREREFNQSAIIASVIGRRFGIPVVANALIRHRHTRPQVELDGKERKENVVGAFSVEDRRIIEGKEIILVDDVYTSGSTVNECARVLKKNGAEKVYVMTIGRMAG